jgi:hypothetical protein
MSLTASLLGAALLNSPLAVLAMPAPQLSNTFDAEDAMTAELKQLSSLLRQLDKDADGLNSLVLSSRQWQTHAFYLNQIKVRVNRIGDRLETLQTIRSIAAPWQLKAIDDLVPVALEVADRTTAAINHLNGNHRYLWAGPYVDHLRAIAALSEQMQGLLYERLKTAEARDKMETPKERRVVPRLTGLG